MAYDDRRYREEGGYRPEPPPSAVTGSGRAPTQAELDDVFDDPMHGEPGRDRVTVHVVWELVLLIAVVGLFVALRQRYPHTLQGAALRDSVLVAAALGLVAFGTSFSLRAAVPNLLVGPLAYGAGVLFAAQTDRGVPHAALVTGLAAAAAGAVLAILVVGLQVPSWAAGLGGLAALLYWLQRQHPGQSALTYHPQRHAYWWFAGVAAVTVLAGSVGVGKPVRRLVGRYRPVRDPARRRGGVAALTAVTALIVSALCAAAGGVLLTLTDQGAARRTVLQAGPAAGGPLTGSELALAGLALTVLAVGACLAGGVSAFGRRGGIAGTILAVVLVVLVDRYTTTSGTHLPELALGAALTGVGLLVTRLVEAFGRPLSAGRVEEEPGGLEDVLPAGGWSGTPVPGWTSRLPPLQQEPRPSDGSWEIDDRWGVR